MNKVEEFIKTTDLALTDIATKEVWVQVLTAYEEFRNKETNVGEELHKEMVKKQTDT